MNGTTNYMLTKMIREGADYDSVLNTTAQDLRICQRLTPPLM